MRAERKEEIEFLQSREQHAQRHEQEARQQVVEMEFRTRAVLEKQRCAIVDLSNFELNIQEAKAENTVQNLTQQLRQHYVEHSRRSQVCETGVHYVFTLKPRETRSISTVEVTQQKNEPRPNKSEGTAHSRKKDS